MKYSMIVLLLATLNSVDIANARQRCDSSSFNCDSNDPCEPLCVEGQHQYPKGGGRKYIECVEGRCTEQRCPPRTTWNQDNLRCEGRNGLETRCSYGNFDCDARNPCTPSLCYDGVEKYPGSSPRRYVNCTEGCAESQCPRRQVWDQDQQRCASDSVSEPVDETRCAYDKFGCDARNPCTPTLCYDGVENYPGSSPHRYVSCTEGCAESECPLGQEWDQDQQRCLTVVCPDGERYNFAHRSCKSASCSWQYTVVNEPAADCSDDYIFHEHPYTRRETSYRHFDGQVDCAAASESDGNRGVFYVKQSNLPNPTKIYSCFAPDGLCLRLTSESNGGWEYTVQNLLDRDTVSNNTNFNDLDFERSDSCFAMEHYDEAATRTPNYEDCYDKGGRLMYSRDATYLGTCAEKIPCGVTTIRDVLIFYYFCEPY